MNADRVKAVCLMAAVKGAMFKCSTCPTEKKVTCPVRGTSDMQACAKELECYLMEN